MKLLLPLFIVTMFTACTQQVASQQVLPLYKTIPNSKQSANKEKTEMASYGIEITTNVSVPTLTVYKPAKPNAQRSAVIVVPGGGYGMVATGHEGTDVAKALNSWGVTAFVLKYRLPNDTIMPDKTIGPLQDAQRAIQMVRENAKEWNIDTNKIGIMGFSAGGHLAATASTQFDNAVISNDKKVSLRPDFSILIYPVISFTDNLTHMGSRDNLIGKKPSQKSVNHYSNELQVTDKTPAAFLVHSADDGAVPVGNSIAYYQALLKHKIYSEMLLYPLGGHGYGMNNPTTADKWMDNLKNWMIAGKFL
ncbi:alpha/beta hydrolase [Flavobacterium subsaxonicum]|uniref:1,4-beta-xylanase n=1 Tax=Flavobacterium subsaxonicum WB 4.1-42 = DSM 21790 TaxID=1121898 RepID=A0A0A2MI60_9FLAO|nr:alpha/beta hydrolase [Flavobacterium subsaxonicum]KGO91999.1 1,4-beta-xylanase [Flavobacterium subsaxonicum WB 4.1-42 = DSM 21790]